MEKIKNATPIAGLVLFLIGLGLFSYLGIYNRYWADDWCYNADFRELGFIGTLKGYTYITTYASNRYSLTFFSGVLYFLGVLGVQIMTPLNILFLFTALFWTLVNIKKILNSSTPKTSIALISAIAIYYSIYLTPHLYQSLYWRSGSLPYFAPLVFSVLIFALIMCQSVLEIPSRLVGIVVGLFAFLAGGFSEAGCATLVTALMFYIAFAWVFRKDPWAKRSLFTAVIALAFSLIAMIVLISSPTTIHRLDLYGKSATLIELPYLILSFSYDFVKFSFTDMPLPHLAIIGISLSLSYLLYTPGKQPLQTKTIVLIILLVAIITFVLISASYAPSAYIEKSPPHPRTRIIPRFILTLAIVIVSWVLGSLTRQFFQSMPYLILSAVLFILLSLYSIRTIWIVSQDLLIFKDRASAWDERAMQIQNAKENGLSEVNVFAIDGLPVGGIRDFYAKGSGRPGYWINICAARYYDIGAINVK